MDSHSPYSKLPQYYRTHTTNSASEVPTHAKVK